MVEKKVKQKARPKDAKRRKQPTADGLTTGPDRSRQSAGLVVVGIGASAGGLEALQDLLDHLPADTGMAFVVVTHQHPEKTSFLPELLGRETKMRVVEALEGVTLEPDHVYVGTPGGHLAISNGILHRLESEKKKSPTLPIDAFFRSLAEDQKELAICIILSGTGSDGTLGLKAIKGESGMVMVQQPQSANYAGMPTSAIATGLVDYVLAPAEMPQQLIAYTQGSFLAAAALADKSPVLPAQPLQRIFLLLRQRTGNDFSGYKSNTLRRRIERRMNIHQIEDPDQYVRYLHEHPREIDLLFKEMLISVTNFFRDPEAWKALDSCLEHLIDSRPEHNTVRAWVPGCATGEEVYSLAIVLQETMDRMNRQVDVQIFGTDLDEDAIAAARAGHYPDGIKMDVSAQRLQRYFTHDDNGYHVRNEIREMVIFARQNVVKDPPFTRMDIITCRNLLIYLNSDLQKKLLPVFHYALVPNGLLFLGPSETVSSLTKLLRPRNKRWKLFERKENSEKINALPQFPIQPLIRDKNMAASLTIDPPANATGTTASHIEKLLLKRLVPACVVVNHQGDIFYIHGHTGVYLEPAQGEPCNNILDMARDGLQIELASALRECATDQAEISRQDIPVQTNGGSVHVDLTVMRIHELPANRDLLLVTFRHRSIPEKGKKGRSVRQAGDSTRIQQLERELQYIRESHQTTLEDLKTSNEELQSANEELQSSNEELETSREEMQSLNEELTTVNTEMQSKVDELSNTNDDMQNLLNGTEIATVFLDDRLNIKRFTERAQSLVMLRPADIGRPISELVSTLESKDLAADCREVLKTLVSKETEVKTRDGDTYLMRILPYRTSENVIDGVVITFVDISQLKAGERARAYFQSIVDTIREPLLILDEDLRIMTANDPFYRDFDISSKQTEGELIYKIASGRWDNEKLRALLEEILPKHTLLENYELDIRLPGSGTHTFALNARRLEQASGMPDRILLSFEDVTHQPRVNRDTH